MCIGKYLLVDPTDCASDGISILFQRSPITPDMQYSELRINVSSQNPPYTRVWASCIDSHHFHEYTILLTYVRCMYIFTLPNKEETRIYISTFRDWTTLIIPKEELISGRQPIPESVCATSALRNEDTDWLHCMSLGYVTW